MGPTTTTRSRGRGKRLGMWLALTTALFAVTLQGCGPVRERFKPEVDARFETSSDLNPDDSGRPSPIVVRIYELASPGTFETADFFTLYEQEAATLGNDMLAREEFELKPNEAKTFEAQLQEDTRYIGVIGAYRNIDQARWRATYEIDGRNNPILIELDEKSVSISKR